MSRTAKLLSLLYPNADHTEAWFHGLAQEEWQRADLLRMDDEGREELARYLDMVHGWVRQELYLMDRRWGGKTTNPNKKPKPKNHRG